MKVAACQMEDVRRDVSRAVSLIQACVVDAERQGAHLVCFPECFLQGYDVDASHVEDVAVDLASSEFSQILRSLKGFEPTIVIGLIEREREARFNSAIVVRRGALVTRSSVDTSKPAICGRPKTGHFQAAETSEIYLVASSWRKSEWTLVRQLRGPHLRTCA